MLCVFNLIDTSKKGDIGTTRVNATSRVAVHDRAKPRKLFFDAIKK